MNVLLIYPKFPDTFWSFSYALRFIGKKVSVLATADVDPGAKAHTTCVGGYPGHLRSPFSEDMRIAYSLIKGSKNQYRRIGIHPG
jgi:hypothetical protein